MSETKKQSHIDKINYLLDHTQTIKDLAEKYISTQANGGKRINWELAMAMNPDKADELLYEKGDAKHLSYVYWSRIMKGNTSKSVRDPSSYNFSKRYTDEEINLIQRHILNFPGGRENVHTLKKNPELAGILAERGYNAVQQRWNKELKRMAPRRVAKRQSSGFQIEVCPTTGDRVEKVKVSELSAQPEPPLPPAPAIKFCPQCGYSLEGILRTMQLTERLNRITNGH